MENSQKSSYDEKGNADHYNTDRINDIVKMERIWGTKNLMVFCEITSFKYRMRMGKKLNQPIDQELKKSFWYDEMAKILKAKIGTDQEVKELKENECQSPMRK